MPVKVAQAHKKAMRIASAASSAKKRKDNNGVPAARSGGDGEEFFGGGGGDYDEEDIVEAPAVNHGQSLVVAISSPVFDPTLIRSLIVLQAQTRRFLRSSKTWNLPSRTTTTIHCTNPSRMMFSQQPRTDPPLPIRDGPRFCRRVSFLR